MYRIEVSIKAHLYKLIKNKLKLILMCDDFHQHIVCANMILDTVNNADDYLVRN